MKAALLKVLGMFAPLVDYVTGRVSAWKAKNSAAFVTLVNPDSGVPYSSASRVPVNSSVPTATSGTILTQTTNGTTGSLFVLFAAQTCTALDIVNNTGVTIEYQRSAAGNAMQIPTGTARMVIGITNANQIGIRRTDQSTTQVTVQAEAFVN